MDKTSSPPQPEGHDVAALRRVEPSLNMARFYLLSLEPTLFGEIAVMRHWGRVGTRGQQKACFVGSLADARAVLDRQAQRKLRRGYVTTGDAAGQG